MVDSGPLCGAGLVSPGASVQLETAASEANPCELVPAAAHRWKRPQLVFGSVRDEVPLRSAPTTSSGECEEECERAAAEKRHSPLFSTTQKKLIEDQLQQEGLLGNNLLKEPPPRVENTTCSSMAS
ncbi:unnamed protein product [Pleuronectes platessa]|uniref:Uncharacterized protein n=1 Tax=Pleuronectes platessa TaxID=8262 RepID=A0A9N7VW44_PLEPL|nr:unnamed protein product [Pleuronectes platessa]